MHLNVPGVWEGYRDVGSFFSDRILFTLGSHWLDSFHHPALRIPALYRLQQYADGSFVHIIHPDYQDSFEITSHATEGGPSVLTLAEKDGEAVAHMVLALADSSVVDEEGRAVGTRSSTGQTSISAQGSTCDGNRARSRRSRESGRNPTLIDMLGSHTVIPVELDERILTLKERGVLLQKIHFARFMEGYDVYIGPTGKISTHLAGERAATIQVRRNEVSLVATTDDARVNGKRLERNAPHALQADAVIELGGVELHYKSLAQVNLEGWPYLGELMRPSGSSYMVFGSSYKIGRDRKNKVRLPDEPNNDNIVWRPEMESGTIRSRTGEIPKSRFYTDSIMVASEHAEIDLADEPVLCSLARHCFTFVRRADRIVPLSPTQTSDGVQKTPLSSGDEILIGNCVFEVSFPPAHGAKPAGAPDRSSSLHGGAARGRGDGRSDRRPGRRPRRKPTPPAPAAIGVEGFALPQRPSPRVEMPNHSVTIASPPAAHGLGEAGGPPPPVPRFSMQESATPSQGCSPSRRRDRSRFRRCSSRGSEDHADPNTDLLQELLGRARQSRRARPSGRRVGVAARATSPGAHPHRRAGWSRATSRSPITAAPTSSCRRTAPSASRFFYPVDYFELFVRGKKGRDPSREPGRGAAHRSTASPRSTPIASRTRCSRSSGGRPTARRTSSSSSRSTKDTALPDPRAMRLAIDTSDPMARALFTIGFPLRSERMVELGPIRASGTFDGERLHLKDYLKTYRRTRSLVPRVLRAASRRLVPDRARGRRRARARAGIRAHRRRGNLLVRDRERLSAGMGDPRARAGAEGDGRGRVPSGDRRREGRAGEERGQLPCREGRRMLRCATGRAKRDRDRRRSACWSPWPTGWADTPTAISRAVRQSARSSTSSRAMPDREPEQELRRFVLKAHAKLQTMARENQASDMGTTILAAWMLQDEVHWVNVGDSRLYHVRNSALRCLTRDQTRGEFARRDGRTAPSDAEHLAQSFVFGSRGLGHDDAIRIDEGLDTGRFRVRSGDQIVLCTDGLWAFVDDYTILEAVRASPDPLDNATWLFDRAMSLGGDDNVTAIVVRFDEVVPVMRQEDPPTRQ